MPQVYGGPGTYGSDPGDSFYGGTTMAAKRFGSIQGLAMRSTRLSDCGVPVSGPGSVATSDGFVSIGLTAELDEGETFEVKTANGAYCIDQKDCPSLRWFNLEIEFCNVDPELFEPMTPNISLVTDVRGDTVGYQATNERVCGNFSLEVWTKVAGNACGALGCGPDAFEQWIYWLMPWSTNGILGDYTIENGPLSMTWTGNTRSNPNWGQGPFDVICLDETAEATCTTPGPLADTPVLANTHLYKRLTSIAPPVIQCGLQELVPVSPVDLGSS